MAGGGGKSTTISSAKKRKIKPEDHHQLLSPLISLVASATSAAYTFLSENDIQLHPSQTLTLESKITSTALSLTKLHSLLQTLNSPKTLTPPPPITSSSSSQSHCWFQRLISLDTEDCRTRWGEAFGMSKSSFNILLNILIRSLQKCSSTISPEYMLGATLFRLAHAASYKSVGRRFGVDSAGACLAFYEVCKAMNEELSYLFEFPSDLKKIIVGFGWLSLPNCCGVLGFSRFLVDGGEFGKDGAVIVQGLVDTEGRFLDVSAGWPTSTSPSTILRQTKLFSRVEESKELLNGPPFEFRDGNLIPQYILGDSCCPLLPWLLTPFTRSGKDANFNTSEQAFNSVHNRGIGLVNSAFRKVRERWKLLSLRWKEECVEFFPFVIMAGCLLHNFLLKCEVERTENEDCRPEMGFPVFEGRGNEDGERIRDVLALHLGLKAGGQITLR